METVFLVQLTDVIRAAVDSPVKQISALIAALFESACCSEEEIELLEARQLFPSLAKLMCKHDLRTGEHACRAAIVVRN